MKYTVMVNTPQGTQIARNLYIGQAVRMMKVYRLMGLTSDMFEQGQKGELKCIQM